MWFIGVEVEQETSALPPKKILNPPLLRLGKKSPRGGSCVWMNWRLKLSLFSQFVSSISVCYPTRIRQIARPLSTRPIFIHALISRIFVNQIGLHGYITIIRIHSVRRTTLNFFFVVYAKLAGGFAHAHSFPSIKFVYGGWFCTHL